MTDTRFYPDYGEMLRIEQAARRERAAEMGRLSALAAGKLKALIQRSVAATSRGYEPRPRSTTGGQRNTETLGAILDDLYASLPEELRARCSQELITAARIAPVIALGIELLEFVVRVVAGTIHGIAQSLRAGAWCLDAAARRLMPLR